MHVAFTSPCSAWDCLQDSPSLDTIRQFLRSIPDASSWRGCGSIADADAMIVLCMSPGVLFCCESPCGT